MYMIQFKMWIIELSLDEPYLKIMFFFVDEGKMPPTIINYVCC